MTIWDKNEENFLAFESPPVVDYYLYVYRITNTYKEKYAALRKMPWGDKKGYILDEFSLLLCEVILFACMTVEAILNLIGFLQLGKVYFEKNVERCRMPQKVTMLFGLILQERISEKGQLATDFKFLFNNRNRLVHAKCSPIKHGSKPKLHELFYEHEPDPSIIEEYTGALERIIDRLVTLTPTKTREYLNIPNKPSEHISKGRGQSSKNAQR